MAWIWITGLSGAGKTTLAKKLQKLFDNCIIVEGSHIRQITGITGYTEEERKKNMIIQYKLSKTFTKEGYNVISVSVTNPDTMFDRDYTLIYVNTPFNVCKERRDFYGNENVVGVDIEYDVVDPDIVVKGW